jgi:2-polyprenyl-3-methyl-5-hydroxy-6-metoxy-1,4-benzoquinol methylase
MVATPKVLSAYQHAITRWEEQDLKTAFNYFKVANRLAEKEMPVVTFPLIDSRQEQFSVEFYAALQEGGLDVSEFVIVVHGYGDATELLASLLTAQGEPKDLDISTVLSSYVESVLCLNQEDLATYLGELNTACCRSDALGFIKILEPYLAVSHCIKISSLNPYLGLLGLWFPQVPVVFHRRDVLDAGLAAYMQPPNKGMWQKESLTDLGSALAEQEQIIQFWATRLPNPIYWVDHDELMRSPINTIERFLSAWHWKQAPGILPKTMVWDEPKISASLGEELTPLLEGYHIAMEKAGLLTCSETVFDWQLQGRVVLIDNTSLLPQRSDFRDLMSTDSLAVVAFDPMSKLSLDVIAGLEEFQYVPRAVLGDGKSATLYATLDENLSALLPPLTKLQQSPGHSDGGKVIAQFPISTVRLDDIDGLNSLDWLILDEYVDALKVVENGRVALKNTLLLQVRVVFQPTHEGQPTLVEMSHWASRHGFSFYRLNDPKYYSLLPKRENVVNPQATQLVSADALFIPSIERQAGLLTHQRIKLAFVLDTYFGIHDLAYQFLNDVSESLAERYLKVRGYSKIEQFKVLSAPNFRNFHARTPQPLQTLANMLSDHRLLPAVHLARQQIEKQENEYEARYYLGLALSHWGSYQESIDEFSKLCGQVRNGTERELRYRLALGWAQLRAGRHKLARRTYESLSSVFSGSLALIHFSVFLWQNSQKNRELKAALQQCDVLLNVSDRALCLAGLGIPAHVRAEILDAKARLLIALSTTDNEKINALDLYSDAFGLIDGYQGPLKARLYTGFGLVKSSLGDERAAVDSIWKACSIYPYSLETVIAYEKLRELLLNSRLEVYKSLAKLHEQVFQLWKAYPDKSLSPCFNDFGLPYQSFETLMLPGSRPTELRLNAYQLKDMLPDHATALDIGCNHGYLLIGLAGKLQKGVGIDTSKVCVTIGNAVAQYLGYTHVHMHQENFADWSSNEKFDLIIVSDVHPWIELPKESLSERLHSLCKPGGVVLFESAGIRNPRISEEDFDHTIMSVLSAGFSIINEGELCDDGLSMRRYCILRQEVAHIKNVKIKKGSAKNIPIMEGEANTLAPMRHICALLSKQGAWFHPHLRVHAEGGNLSLHGMPGSQRQSYLRVPMSSMPHLECFTISLKDNKFSCQTNGTSLLPNHHEMMETMIELYNVTGKAALWAKSLPFLAWKGEPALQLLLSLRGHDQRFENFQNLAIASDYENLIVKSFFGSRQFGMREQHLQALGMLEVKEKRNVLLPVIDCLNHSLDAEGFTTPTDNGELVMRTFHQPLNHSGELLVRYNYYDAVDTLLGYGFVDVSSHWLASVPMKLFVNSHVVEVKSNKVVSEVRLPHDIADLRSYMPMISSQNENLTRVTKLMLCVRQPFSLRRILTYMVYHLGLAHTELVAENQVRSLEKQVIEYNFRWWKSFALEIDHLPPHHAAQQLCQHSLGLISALAEQLEVDF